MLEALRHTPLDALLRRLEPDEMLSLREIRVRVGRPVMARVGEKNVFFTGRGFALEPLAGAETVTAEYCQRLLDALTKCSAYAYEDELRMGYMTLDGGHRVGVSGQVQCRDGRVVRLKHATGFHIRVASAVPGCATRVLPHLTQGARPLSTLVIAPPGAGKTTLLRDIARQMGAKLRVTVIDERGEIAGCTKGVPSHDVGLMTDVLDGCAKAEGVMMALRALSPDALIVDEIGGAGDVSALEEAARCGVAVIASAHGRALEDVRLRPTLRGIINARAFERFITLDTPGGMLGVFDADGRRRGM